MTSYAYDSAGDVMQITNPLGLVTKYTYDNLGRELTQTQVSDTYPAGLTTSYTYDGQDRIVTETDPPVTDRVTGAVHTKVTSYTYDADSDVLTTTISDATGGDPSRTTTNTYNAHGQLASTTDALGNTTTYTYDALRRPDQPDQPGRGDHRLRLRRRREPADHHAAGLHRQPGQPDRRRTTWCRSPGPTTRPGGWPRSPTSRARTTDYTYYGNNQLASSYVVGSGQRHREGERHHLRLRRGRQPDHRDRPGRPGHQHRLQRRRPGRLADARTRPGRTASTTATYDADGNVITKTLTGGGVTQTETMTYNAMDQAAVADGRQHRRRT